MERRFQVIDNGLDMNVPGSKQQEGVALSPQQQEYLLPHFLMLVVGKPGSGKTMVIRQLLSNSQMYKNSFDEVLVVSPSYQKLGLSGLKKKNLTSKFQLQWIFERLERINADQQQEQRKAEQLMRGGSDRAVHNVLQQQASAYNMVPRPASNPDMAEEARRALGRVYGSHRFFSDQPPLPNPTRPTIFSNSLLFRNQQQSKLQQSAAAASNGKDSMVPPQLKGKAAELDQQRQRQDEETKGEREQQLYDKLKKLPPEVQRSFYKNVLLVLDDVVGDIKKNENDPRLAQLIMNRRHLVHNGMVSIVMVTQKYTLIPARVRSNANWLILFKLNPLDFENVFRDSITMSQQQWHDVLQFVFGSSETKTAVEEEGGGGVQKEPRNAMALLKEKKYDNLGIWVEFDVLFRNFKQMQMSALPT